MIDFGTVLLWAIFITAFVLVVLFVIIMVIEIFTKK